MNSLKDEVDVVTDAMYVILGGEREHRLDHRQFSAIGGQEGARRRVATRARLQRFVRQGAEARSWPT